MQGLRAERRGGERRGERRQSILLGTRESRSSVMEVEWSVFVCVCVPACHGVHGRRGDEYQTGTCSSVVSIDTHKHTQTWRHNYSNMG